MIQLLVMRDKTEVIRERKREGVKSGSYMLSGAKPEGYHRLRVGFVSSLHQLTSMVSKDIRMRGTISWFV